MAASACFVGLVLLSLGLSSEALDNVKDTSGLLAVFKASAPPLKILLHLETALASPSATFSLESVIRSEVAGDWERGKMVLQLANQARTWQLKRAIYEVLWQELQLTKQIYDPAKILDFYVQLAKHPDVSPNLLELVYQSFIERSAQLIAAPFHTSNLTAQFPVVNALLQRLTLSTVDYLRDILEALYDMVLALETPLSVVQRLGNFSASLTQLTLANLELLHRHELSGDAQAQLEVQANLRYLLRQPQFEEQVNGTLRQQLYEQLSADELVLYTAQKVCLRNITEPNFYIYECPQTYLICSNVPDPKKASYLVQRGHFNNTVQFAFYSSYWSNRYIEMEPVPTSTNNNITIHRITKNVYSKNAIYWWRVVFGTEGVTLYDAATGNSVLCGGDPMHWDNEERHVYTRNAKDFKAFRNECTWKVEDCSDAVHN